MFGSRALVFIDFLKNVHVCIQVNNYHDHSIWKIILVFKKNGSLLCNYLVQFENKNKNF